MTTHDNMKLGVALGVSYATILRWKKQGKAPEMAKLACAWLIEHGAIKADALPAVLEMGAEND